jgi:nicotinate phosphoribosyltransferase
MFHAALGGYPRANAWAMDAWAGVYRGALGIALTDTFTTGAFLRDFDAHRARLWDGVRQDSGDPLRFVDLITAHYRALDIDPLTKTVVFSDGLDVDRAVAIRRYCAGKVSAVFGIGTSLTNDVGASPLNMVIKMARCRPSPDRAWRNTVKLSDDPGKWTGRNGEIRHCLEVLKQSH